jgi:Protein of unknown function (DUF938)
MPYSESNPPPRVALQYLNERRPELEETKQWRNQCLQSHPKSARLSILIRLAPMLLGRAIETEIQSCKSLKSFSRKAGTFSNLQAALAIISTISRPIFSNCDSNDYNLDVFETIKQKRAEEGNANVADPITIDLTSQETWPDPKDRLYDVIFVVNLFQVAPVSIADGIAQVASRVLTKEGFVAIYGPFKVDGKYTTQSNEAFDKEILAAQVNEWASRSERSRKNCEQAWHCFEEDHRYARQQLHPRVRSRMNKARKEPIGCPSASDRFMP